MAAVTQVRILVPASTLYTLAVETLTMCLCVFLSCSKYEFFETSTGEVFFIANVLVEITAVFITSKMQSKMKELVF